jgi:4-amino-4-deoxy-L-arabinose transferase-like glycosyltransferase
MEGRWAMICRDMMATGDYFHPMLLGESYFDKPAPSYWLMILAARAGGSLNEWTLRLPGVLAGLLTLWCTVRLGRQLLGPEVGILAGWILATSYWFVHWSRIASSDMLNAAAVWAALAWYFERRDRPGLGSYSVFFLMLAVGSLFKGIVAAVMVGLALLPDLFAQGRWKLHRRGSLVPAAGLGLAAYFIPFILSSGGGFSEGLHMVYQENVLRFLEGFDHKEPWYFYFLWLPLYLIPWTPFFAVALGRAVRYWKELAPASRWTFWVTGILFVFLSASRSKRHYYLLPVLPLAALAVAEWLKAQPWGALRSRFFGWTIGISAAGLGLWFVLAVPYISTQGGMFVFRREVKAAAERVAPYDQWQVLYCNIPPDAAFYLSPPGSRVRRMGTDQGEEIRAFLREHPRTILVSYGSNRKLLEELRPGGPILEERPRIPAWMKLPSDPSRRQIAGFPPGPDPSGP